MGLKEYADNLGLEEEDFRELTQLFIETTKADLDKLTNALREKDFIQLRDAAHSIKGAAGNLGFMDIFQAASVCEKAAIENDDSPFSEKIEEMMKMTDDLTGLL